MGKGSDDYPQQHGCQGITERDAILVYGIKLKTKQSKRPYKDKFSLKT